MRGLGWRGFHSRPSGGVRGVPQSRIFRSRCWNPRQLERVSLCRLRRQGARVNANQAKAIQRETTLESVRSQLDRVLYSCRSLHEEMMRLPLHKRRQRWDEYYTRLDGLTRQQQELERELERLQSSRS